MRPGGERAGSDGFLLAETLAVMTITAAVLVFLVAGAASLINASDRTLLNVSAEDHWHRTLAALVRDLSHASRARWNGEEPQSYIFSGNETALLFTVLDTTLPYATQKVIRLRQTGFDSRSSLTWQEARLSPTASGLSAVHFGPIQSLDLAGFRVAFSFVGEVPLAPDAQKQGIPDKNATPSPRHKEIVRTSWPSGLSLPLSVMVTVKDVAAGRPVVRLRVPILANADTGCIGNGDASRADGPQHVASAVPNTRPELGVPPPGALPAGDSTQPQADGSPRRASFCSRTPDPAQAFSSGEARR